MATWKHYACAFEQLYCRHMVSRHFYITIVNEHQRVCSCFFRFTSMQCLYVQYVCHIYVERVAGCYNNCFCQYWPLSDPFLTWLHCKVHSHWLIWASMISELPNPVQDSHLRQKYLVIPPRFVCFIWLMSFQNEVRKGNYKIKAI